MLRHAPRSVQATSEAREAERSSLSAEKAELQQDLAESKRKFAATAKRKQAEFAKRVIDLHYLRPGRSKSKVSMLALEDLCWQAKELEGEAIERAEQVRQLQHELESARGEAEAGLKARTDSSR